MNLGLAGKVALVTGGARDVGREISLTLAREGAAVAVNYMHSKADAETVVAEITRAGGRAAAYQADVADYAAVGRMIDRIVAEMGRLDVVVNNAGYVEAKLFVDTKPEEWKRQVDVDLYGVFNVCHAAAPKLAAQHGGRVISIVGDKEFIAKNRERILAFYPIRRLGKPEDVAPLVAFLASDLAGWVTGQTISVSGGYSTV